jgi:hypothetical protein
LRGELLAASLSVSGQRESARSGSLSQAKSRYQKQEKRDAARKLIAEELTTLLDYLDSIYTKLNVNI